MHDALVVQIIQFEIEIMETALFFSTNLIVDSNVNSVVKKKRMILSSMVYYI